MKEKTIILGGGISGLASAYQTVKKGEEVILYERKERLGGMIYTNKSPFGIIESAANGFILTDGIKEILQTLSIDSIQTKKESKRRFFYHREKASQLPISLMELVKSIFGLLFKDSTPRTNENFYDWSCRIFGKNITSNLIEPAIGGIYASDLNSLDPRMVFYNLDWSSPSSLFKRFKKNKKKNKTYGLVSFQNGMGELITALDTFISPHVKIFLNSDAPLLNELEKNQYPKEIHICLSLKECKEYLERNGYRLPNVSLLNVSTVTCFYSDRLLKKPGFGLLFPKHAGIEANGVLFNSDIFDGRIFIPGIHSETWIYAGDKLKEISDLDLLQMQDRDRSRIYGKSMTPLHYQVTQWKESFPIYNQELLFFNERLDEIEKEWNKKNIKLSFKGNYRRGIGLRSLVEMATT